MFFSNLQCSRETVAVALNGSQKTAAKQESHIETRSLNWLLCQTFSRLSKATETHRTITGPRCKVKRTHIVCAEREMFIKRIQYGTNPCVAYLNIQKLTVKESEGLK